MSDGRFSHRRKSANGRQRVCFDDEAGVFKPSRLGSLSRGSILWRLSYAVLAVSLADLVGKNQAWKREALGWVEGVWGGGPFSFAAVCVGLGLEPGAVRDAVRKGLEKANESESA